MTRYLLTWLCMLVLSGTAAASPRGGRCFEGPYVGIAGGLAHNMADYQIEPSASYDLGLLNIVGLTGLVEVGKPVKVDIYDLAPFGEVFAGVGLRLGSVLYAGVRAGVNFSHFDLATPYDDGFALNIGVPVLALGEVDLIVDSQLVGVVRTTKRTVEATLDLKPGIVLGRSMVFGIAGAAFTRTRISGESTFQLGLDIDVVVSPVDLDLVDLEFENPLSYQEERSSAGLRVGVGVEHMLTGNISIMASYVYTDYWSLKSRAAGDTGVILPLVPLLVNGQQVDVRVAPARGVASMGLSYYF